MKDQLFSVLQRLGRSFMLPIAILPVAGLFLGIGGSFTNATTLETYGLTTIMGEGTFLNLILQVMTAAGDIVFGNLPLIFAIGSAIGMAKSEKATAALAAAISFLIMHASIGTMVQYAGGAEAYLEGSVTGVLGLESLQMGVFGGMIVGLGVAYLHNKYYKIKLPAALSFFEGTRFVPIISAIVFLFVGILMSYVWPPVQQGIYAVGELVQGSGYAGTWLYGLMERLLIPFGLHHVFYLPFWQTAVGGTLEVGGVLVEGAQNIFFAQLADPATTVFSVEATRFMSGKFPLMIFGLPGAALAMYRLAKPENRKATGGLLLSAALTSMLTGITEPLEFTFLFVAPVLYVIHSIFAGAAYMLMHIFNVGVGMTFSGGFIDMFLYGILQGNAKTNWIWIVFVGIAYFIVYYFLFYFLIKKFDFKTPGREDSNEDIKLFTRADVEARKNGSKTETEDTLSAEIIYGLGGVKNISDIDSCATRLRATVIDETLVDNRILDASGASAVVKRGRGVQIIYGPRVSIIKSQLEEFIESGQADALPPKEEYFDNYVPANESAQSVKKTYIDTTDLPVVEAISSPMEGRIIPISEVPDDAFSSTSVGNGFGIVPTDGTVTAPVNGKVTMIFETKHAIGLVTDSGVEVMIHVGLDTVNMKGEGFNAHVEAGDIVKVGDVLLDVDLAAIKHAGYSVITPVVITNTNQFNSVELMHLGKAEPQKEVLVIK